MRKTILAAVAAIAFMLPACGEGTWSPTPGTPLKIGLNVTAANPLPAGCDSVARSPVTLEGLPIFDVMALPTPETVTVRPSGLVTSGNDVTVDRTCVVGYAYHD
jgi:hypothetical protein